MFKSILAPALVLAGLSMAPLVFCDTAARADGATRHAELMHGKSTLFRRVVTKPGGQLLAKPGATARVLSSDVPAFSVYYVYGEENGFTEVGANSHGDVAGWIDSEKVVDWKQSIVVAFNNRGEADRVRHVFYDDIDQLADDLERFDNPSDFASSDHVVAIEPENAINDHNNFYLLPILDHESTYFPR